MSPDAPRGPVTPHPPIGDVPRPSSRKRLATWPGLLVILVIIVAPLVYVAVQWAELRSPSGADVQQAEVTSVGDSRLQNDSRRQVEFRTDAGDEGSFFTDRKVVGDSVEVWQDPDSGDWVSSAQRSWVGSVKMLIFGTGLGIVLLVGWIALFRKERAARRVSD